MALLSREMVVRESGSTNRHLLAMAKVDDHSDDGRAENYRHSRSPAGSEIYYVVVQD